MIICVLEKLFYASTIRVNQIAGKIKDRAVISQRKTIVKSKDPRRYIRFLLANKRAMRDLSISQVYILNSIKPWTPKYPPLDGPTIDDLNKYGCVCAGIKSGKKPLGKPVDDLDRACFAWRKCYRCVGQQCGGYSLNKIKQCSKWI